MQTFLPDPGFSRSARLLDDRRLGKQRVETFQILRALIWPSYGWKNHPAVVLWRGFTPALVAYGVATCREWAARGHADALEAQLLDYTGGARPDVDRLRRTGLLPPWLGDDAVHASHRRALADKGPDLYPAEWRGPTGYVWPGSIHPRWPLPLPPDPVTPSAAVSILAGWGMPADRFDPGAAEWSTLRRLARGLGDDAPDPPDRWVLLACALVVPGRVAVLLDRPALAPDEPLPPPAEPRGSVSGSIARTPTDADVTAMGEEAASSSRFGWFRRGDEPDAADVTLVVTDGAPVPDTLASVPILRSARPGERATG